MTVLDRFRLDGQVALVTGAAGGIGGAMVEAMAEAGADVAAVDVAEDDLEATAERVSSETGSRVEPIVADVSDETETEEMVATTVDELGGLDVAFPNAGISVRGGPTPEYDMDTWDRVTSVNLRGAFLTARAATGHLVDHGGGRLIFTASIMGFQGTQREGLAAYSASKGGIVQLTRQLAGEFVDDGIRVNAIAPGLIETGMTEDGIAEFADDDGSISRRVVPLGRIGQPEDLKGTALFLASEASPYTTGEIVMVDGGMRAI